MLMSLTISIPEADEVWMKFKKREVSEAFSGTF
jgi:hypothetical protein